VVGAVRRPAVQVVRKPLLHMTEEIGTIPSWRTASPPAARTTRPCPFAHLSTRPFTHSATLSLGMLIIPIRCDMPGHRRGAKRRSAEDDCACGVLTVR
jgi:hypothetical protein